MTIKYQRALDRFVDWHDEIDASRDAIALGDLPARDAPTRFDDYLRPDAFGEQRGGKGDDVLRGDAQANFFRAGPGSDVAIGKGGDDVIRGGKGRDALFGDHGDDLLFGGKGRDLLVGGPGKDRLDGGNGADVMIGGHGRDTFVVGDGDVLIGVSGRDRIVWTGEATAFEELTVAFIDGAWIIEDGSTRIDMTGITPIADLFEFV